VGRAPRLLLILVAIRLVAQDRLTQEEERGRQIFEHGTSASGRAIEASIAGDTRVAGSIVPCANCHGPDGLGRPEAGVVPSNISWDALTKPYGFTHADGRTHSPYTERLLRRAITMGIDPAGNTLNNAMPRFQLSMADAADLVAYIKKLGQIGDPGLSGETVRLGVILPPPSLTGETSRIVRQTLLDCFARVNGAGGIFGRRVELSFKELPLAAAQRSDAVRDFLRSEHIFAVMGSDFTGSESELAAVMLATGTPAIAALAPFPQTASPLNRYVFYLDGGEQEEVDALVGFAMEKFQGKGLRLAIVTCDEDAPRETAQWLRTRLADSKLGQLVERGVPQQPLGAGIVFWLCSGMNTPPMADRGNGQAVLLIPGSLAGTAALLIPNAQVFIALGTAWPAENAIPDSDAVDRMAWERATASAAVITEAMMRAGRGLTREGLLQALEGFSSVETNLRVPISFGPNRRIGASDVRIMMVDTQSRKLVPAQGVGETKTQNEFFH
jgi:ABC-type branched-subunit amino acid transport system substrate-binding protein